MDWTGYNQLLQAGSPIKAHLVDRLVITQLPINHRMAYY